MPDATSRFFSSRLPLFLVLALLPCLLSNSCASTTSSHATASGKKLSASAETDYHFLIYQDLLRQGKKDEATKALEDLTQRFPSPELAVELANLQWGQNHREQATATLEKALAAFPDARELTFYLASAYQMRRMTDEACRTLQHFLERHPKDGPAVRELASIMLDVGRDRDAADLLQKLPEADRGATDFFLLAKAQSGMGQPQAAIRSLRAAVNKNPGLMPAWADLATLLEQTGDLQGAEDCYRKMLAQGDATGEVRTRLVRLAIKRKDPAAASKLLATGKRDKAFLLSAMSAFIEAKYVKQARQALAFLENADPDNPELLFYQAVLAYEGENNPQAAMDILANECGIDPFDFREQNLLEWAPFTTNPRGQFPSGYAPEVFPLPEMMKKARPIYEEMKKKAAELSTDEVKYGVGVSCSIYNSNDDGADEAKSDIELTKDGVTIYNTWEDHGQGAVVGSIGTAMEALKPLHLRMDQFKTVLSDTKLAPNSGAAAASRSQVMVGNAIIDSCNKLLDAMRKPDGSFRTYDEMVAENLPLRYNGYTQARVAHPDGTTEVCSGNDKDTGIGRPFGFHMFAVNLAMVSVNMKTYKAHCEKFVLCGDVGKINNYLIVDGQQIGGVAQGIGFALSEDFLDESKYNNFVTMGFPYIKDIPDDIELIHFETPRPLGPFGASGTGEMPLSGPHVAVCNAIHDATGARILRIPAIPQRIREAYELAKKVGKAK